MSERPADKHHRAFYLQLFPQIHWQSIFRDQTDGKPLCAGGGGGEGGRALGPFDAAFLVGGDLGGGGEAGGEGLRHLLKGKRKGVAERKTSFLPQLIVFFLFILHNMFSTSTMYDGNGAMSCGCVATAAATEVFGYFFGMLFVVFSHVTWLPWPPPPPAAAATAPPSASGRTRRCMCRLPS